MGGQHLAGWVSEQRQPERLNGASQQYTFRLRTLREDTRNAIFERNTARFAIRRYYALSRYASSIQRGDTRHLLLVFLISRRRVLKKKAPGGGHGDRRRRHLFACSFEPGSNPSASRLVCFPDFSSEQRTRAVGGGWVSREKNTRCGKRGDGG